MRLEVKGVPTLQQLIHLHEAYTDSEIEAVVDMQVITRPGTSIMSSAAPLPIALFEFSGQPNMQVSGRIWWKDELERHGYKVKEI